MTYFYNSSTKTYIVAFSKLFSDIHVKRFNSAEVEQKDIKVPLIYASKRKLSYLLQQNPRTTGASFVLPVISFVIEGLDFNSERKMNNLNEHQVSSTESIYAGQPWDYNFELTVRTKYQDDYWQILEQILYLMKPEVSLDVKELKDFPTWVRDTMVTLESVSLENDLELSQEEDSVRDFRASLSFKLKGFIYPASTEDTRIEHIDVNFIDYLDNEIVNISHDWIPPDIKTTITEKDN